MNLTIGKGGLNKDYNSEVCCVIQLTLLAEIDFSAEMSLLGSQLLKNLKGIIFPTPLDFQVFRHSVLNPPSAGPPKKHPRGVVKIIPLSFFNSLDPNQLISAEKSISARKASRDPVSRQRIPHYNASLSVKYVPQVLSHGTHHK